MRTLRIVVWALVLVAGAILAIFLLTPRPDSSSQGNAIELAGFGGPFTLVGADGKAFSSSRLNGRPHALFFGFTHCPDVCPTTLSQLAQAQDAWRALPEATRPQLLFVSVDPARDTPGALAKYARHFHADTRVATAAEPELHAFVQALGMVYMKVPQPGGDYMMDHSATLVVLDPQGRQAGLVRPPFDPEAIAADLAKLAKAAP